MRGADRETEGVDRKNMSTMAITGGRQRQGGTHMYTHHYTSKAGHWTMATGQ